LIKFYVPEILSDRAERLLAKVEREEIGLLAPDLIYPEAGNTLWMKQRLKELTRSEVEEITDAILSLPLKIEASKPLLSFARVSDRIRDYCLRRFIYQPGKSL